MTSDLIVGFIMYIVFFWILFVGHPMNSFMHPAPWLNDLI